MLTTGIGVAELKRSLLCSVLEIRGLPQAQVSIVRLTSITTRWRERAVAESMSIQGSSGK